MLHTALHYVSRGLAVFPCHSVREDGACTCLKGRECQNTGKHPHTYNGVKDATLDVARVHQWFTQWPYANVAIATGRVSGVVVIDVDPRHDGHNSLERWQEEYGYLPRTISASTGGGGKHLFFKYPDGGCPGRNPWLPGIEVKSDGGYVIAPPSKHVSGLMYGWDPAPEGVSGFADMPPDLLESISSRRSTVESSVKTIAEMMEGVAEGERDNVLYREACSLRRKLDDNRELIEIIICEWAARCSPPFPREEALRKVDQAFKADHSDPPGIPPAAANDAVGNRRLTDLGNANRLIDRYGGEIAWTSAAHWMIWDDRRWATDETQRVPWMAQQVASSIWAEALQKEDAERQALLGWARQSENTGKLAAMVKEAIPLVARAVDEFDRDPWSLNVLNGTLDLRTGNLRPHDPQDWITKLAPVRWDDDARCPLWESILRRILPDEQLRLVLQRAIGYSLTGSTQEKMMFILRGEGDNGKTVITDVIRMLMGDYASVAAKTLFVTGSGIRKDPDYELASLLGVRFALSSEEIAAGEKLNAGLVKSMTGGDRMKARNPFKTPFTFTPELKLWLATNHLPRISDFGRALWGRLCVFPFEVTIPKDEQIPRDQLLNMLMEESAGILRWCMEGCAEWGRSGVKMTLEQEMMRANWKDEEKGHLLDFIEQCVVRDDEGFVSLGEMASVYQVWCGVNGETHPYGRNTLKANLEAEGIVYARGAKGRGWKCRLRPVGIAGMR